MIKYLQSLRAKKGFTLIELIVVIAIIAVLIAIILPNIGSDKAKRDAADMRARDFYSAVQYCFTKYMKYESYLSIDMKTETDIISYKKELNGNYPTNKYTYIEMYVNNSQIQYVHAKSSLIDLLSEPTQSCVSLFDSVLMKDIGSVIDSEQDGYYYALIQFNDASTPLVDVTATVKVHSAFYTEEEIVLTAGNLSDYRDAHLFFSDYSKLADGLICGACTSVKDTQGRFLGSPGTYFMNVDESLTNA